MIHITSDWSEVEAELDRLSVMPSPKATALLRAVLETGASQVQQDVHIDTGSLRASQKTDEDISYVDQTWTGSIKMGGPTTGPKNPVDYAIYEKRRGGAHDFFATLPSLHPAYIAAMKAAMD